MTDRSKKHRLLLTMLLLVVTLGALYVGWPARFSAAISARLSSFNSRPRGPTAQIRGLAPHSVQAGDPVARTSSSTSTSQNEKATSEKAATSATIRHGTDKSVIGQTFEISASVKDGCKIHTIECPLVMASVKKMTEEPRDIDWAAKMEATIQSAFESQGSDKFVIRNVECRTSICILEVEVHAPGPAIRYEDAIFSRLRPHALTYGVGEYDSTGASYHIQLMDFERR